MGSLLFAQLRYPACMHLVVGTILVASHRLGHDKACLTNVDMRTHSVRVF